MPFPLGAVLSAAPGVISAAGEIMELIRKRKSAPAAESISESPEQKRIDELSSVVEKQAELIEELARNNRNLALAVRNNRLIAATALIIAFASVLASVLI